MDNELLTTVTNVAVQTFPIPVWALLVMLLVLAVVWKFSNGCSKTTELQKSLEIKENKLNANVIEVKKKLKSMFDEL